MACSACGPSGLRGQGHFGSYVKAGSRQIYTNTGPLANQQQRMSGLGLDLGPDWITGIPNMYLLIGGGLLLVLVMMK
jgi:hypothetical protein